MIEHEVSIPYLARPIWCGHRLLIVDTHTIFEFNLDNYQLNPLFDRLDPIDSRSTSCSDNAEIISAYSTKEHGSLLYVFHNSQTTVYNAGINTRRNFGNQLSENGDVLVVDQAPELKAGTPVAGMRILVSDSLPIFWKDKQPIIRRNEKLLNLLTGKVIYDRELSSEVEKIDFCENFIFSQIRRYDDSTFVEVTRFPTGSKLSTNFQNNAMFIRSGDRCIVYNVKLRQGISVIGNIFPFHDGKFESVDLYRFDIEPEPILFPFGCKLAGQKLNLKRVGKDHTQPAASIILRYNSNNCNN